MTVDGTDRAMGSFIACRVRAAIRSGWRAYVGAILLLGILGGMSMFAIAGARRTQSAYPRFLRAANVSTMAIDNGGYDAKRISEIAAFPEVKSSRTYMAPFGGVMGPDGRPDFAVQAELLASVDGRYFDQDRFTPTSGRLPDIARVEEIVVNEAAAQRYGWKVGQSLQLGMIDEKKVPESGPLDAPIDMRIKATIVGVGLFTEEVLQDETDASPLILGTPAFATKTMKYAQYAWQGLVLNGGDGDVEAVRARNVGSSDGNEGISYAPRFIRVTAVDTYHALAAERPLAISIALFGVIAGLAGLVLVGQAVVRQLQTERELRAVLRALGTPPWASAVAAVVTPVVVILSGTVLAVVVALLASPLMPVGRVRRVETARGFQADWAVLGFGAIVLISLLSAMAWFTALREEPQRVISRGKAVTRRSRVVGAAQAGGLSPSAVAGLRMSFEPGAGRTAVPVRSVMTSTIVAVVSIISAVTFGSSLHALVGHPRLYGWDWDATLMDNSGYGSVNMEKAHKVLDADPDVVAWTGAFFGSGEVDGANIALLGVTPGASVHPPIVEGRSIESPDEIAIGSSTLQRLGKHVGDSVLVGKNPHPLRVVGEVTLPTLGIVHGEHPSLGVGAMVDYHLVPGYDRNQEYAGFVGPNALFVQFRKEAVVSRVLSRFGKVADLIGPHEMSVLGPQRPAEIVNTTDIGSSPRVLAGLLGLAALVTLGLGLGMSVRRRRRDLALLKALGFTSSQTAATVRWQATATIVVGLVVGVPMGVALGRVLWVLFARQLAVVPEASTPVVLILSIAAAALVLGNLVAAVPGRMAGRVSPSLVLGSE